MGLDQAVFLVQNTKELRPFYGGEMMKKVKLPPILNGDFITWRKDHGIHEFMYQLAKGKGYAAPISQFLWTPVRLQTIDVYAFEEGVRNGSILQSLEREFKEYSNSVGFWQTVYLSQCKKLRRALKNSAVAAFYFSW